MQSAICCKGIYRKFRYGYYISQLIDYSFLVDLFNSMLCIIPVAKAHLPWLTKIRNDQVSAD